MEWRKGVTPFLFSSSQLTPMTEGTGWAAPRTERKAQPPGGDGAGSLSPATGLQPGRGHERPEPREGPLGCLPVLPS